MRRAKEGRCASLQSPPVRTPTSRATSIRSTSPIRSRSTPARAGTGPVFYSPEIDYWVVTRYEEIREIFRDPQTFSSENTQAPYRPRPPEVQRILTDGGFSVVTGLSGKQPPDHTRLRGFIKLAFTPRRIADAGARDPPDRRAMIDGFAGRGRADLVTELAHELPALVIFRMLGIPDADVPQVKEWAQSRVYMNFGDRPPNADPGRRRGTVAGECTGAGAARGSAALSDCCCSRGRPPRFGGLLLLKLLCNLYFCLLLANLVARDRAENPLGIGKRGIRSKKNSDAY